MPYSSWKVTVLMTRTSLSTVSDLAAWQERRWCEQQPPQRSSRVQPGHTSACTEAVTFPVPVPASWMGTQVGSGTQAAGLASSWVKVSGCGVARTPPLK